MNHHQQKIYIVSDSIGETADRMVHAALTQFNLAQVDTVKFSHINTVDKLRRIMETAATTTSVVAYTFALEEMNQEIKALAQASGIKTVDLLHPLVETISETFGAAPKNEPGMMRKLDEEYFRRIEAVEFAVKYDDAQDPSGLKKADLVLVGVSRTSKTPLSMYLAHKQLKVANVPLVPEVPIPEELYQIRRDRCIGLIISPEKLNDIRRVRLKSMGLNEKAEYASMQRILEEMEYAEKIMKRIGCPVIDVSNKAVEETASYILDVLKVERSAVK
ncbi:pyruvate, water dikinase regulatory protein [Alkalicoccus daliensis]|uniref:Putative pyruvate, phosphate dikinase regulatory protein n=1 Tax=Alkalicoccus daliensis TaxID=745820 RepID=A0A1H0KPW8_9BACI|nr:pyruvate, water dikinase regulatory protein [Alkalicoccus daliensis]SDO57812.1 hypothetical protein SAMN04488053_11919 [Alkalicoccus daliensis]